MGLLLRSGDDRLAVCRLSAGATVPDWIDGRVISVTRTPSELSIVCAEASVPDEIRSERGWRYLEVAGPLDFSLTGVVSTLTVPLADAGILVFVRRSSRTSGTREASAQPCRRRRSRSW